MSRATDAANLGKVARLVFQLEGPHPDEETTVALIEDPETGFATMSIASDDPSDGPGGGIIMSPHLALELADKLRAWAETRANERRGGN